MNIISYIFIALLSVSINNLLIHKNEFIIIFSTLSLYILPILDGIYTLNYINR